MLTSIPHIGGASHNVLCIGRTRTWRIDMQSSKTVHHVIVDKADGLHEGVADGGAHEFEPSAEQVAAQGVGLRSPWRNCVEALPTVDTRLPADKSPDVG